MRNRTYGNTLYIFRKKIVLKLCNNPAGLDLGFQASPDGYNVLIIGNKNTISCERKNQNHASSRTIASSASLAGSKFATRRTVRQSLVAPDSRLFLALQRRPPDARLEFLPRFFCSLFAREMSVETQYPTILDNVASFLGLSTSEASLKFDEDR